MKITIIAGARPNFIKIAPIIKAIQKKQIEIKNLTLRLVHTGQHYDENLSETFFKELNIPKPNTNLGVKSGSQAEQTGAIMIAFEKELQQFPADLVLVVGDVNSTMACTIVAKKMNIFRIGFLKVLFSSRIPISPISYLINGCALLYNEVITILPSVPFGKTLLFSSRISTNNVSEFTCQSLFGF